MSKKFYDDFIFELKYRPKKIQDLILPSQIKNQFLNIIKNKNIPNLLLSGQQGIGKTTSAFCLCNELGINYNYINMSKNTGIDVIRNQTETFASTASVDGKKKVIIGDECLEENEEIAIGTMGNTSFVKLKDLPSKQFELPSLNMETQEIENDVGEIISDKIDDVFIVELDDGRTIKVTKNHPFLVKNKDG
jgi:DNA polymerase III delta prime subunit